MNRHVPKLVFAIVISLMATSCGQFLQTIQGAGNTQRPTLTYQSARLVKSPSTTSLLAHYCPSALPSALCTAALGRAPAKNDLRFDFALRFRIDNPYTVPIPTLSMLLATTLFNDDPNAQELGAVCVSFCEPGDASCSGTAAQGACDEDRQDNIDSFDDFANNAKRELLNIATNGLDASYADNLKIKTIPAQGSSDLEVVFTLGLDPMLNVLNRVAVEHAKSAAQSGQIDQPITIPYAVRGTVWLDLPSNLGRWGLPFGPSASTWQLEL